MNPNLHTPISNETATDLHAVMLLQSAELVELRLKIAALEDSSDRDLLTGLINRRAMEQAIIMEQHRLLRNLSRGALLVLIDLEGYARIHATQGNAAGDRCLILAATTLRGATRPFDAAARLQADNFALLLTGTEPESALNRVQRLSLELNRLVVPWQGHQFSLGASVGIHIVCPKTSVADLLAMPDGPLTPRSAAKASLARSLLSIPTRGGGRHNLPLSAYDV
jgi:diguanylate cyclase (GGDEF)-like protein